MRTVTKLILLFTLVPLLEAYLLVTLGSLLGFWPTVGIVLVTGVVGGFLAKREGLRVFRQWNEALAQGRLPEEGLVGGLLVLVGGVLLVTPGVLTDITGVALMIPQSRRFVGKHVQRYFERRIAAGAATTTTRVRVDMGDGRVMERVETHFGGRRSRDPNVIDVDGEVLEERRRGDPKGQLES